MLWEVCVRPKANPPIVLYLNRISTFQNIYLKESVTKTTRLITPRGVSPEGGAGVLVPTLGFYKNRGLGGSKKSFKRNPKLFAYPTLNPGDSPVSDSFEQKLIVSDSLLSVLNWFITYVL